MTQPAVSLRIANLEDQFGTKLLERGPRHAVPTAQGRLLLSYAERFMTLRAEMNAAIAAPDALSGVVRLGVSETIVHTWLARFIEDVHARFPRVTLDIEVDVSPILAERLGDHRLDIAFLLGEVPKPTIVAAPLCRYPLAFVASPALPLPNGILSPADLAGWPIITYPRTTRPYIELMRIFNAPGLTPPRVYSSSSLSTIIRMAVDGIGISVVPPVVTEAERAQSRLRIVPVGAPLPDLVYSVAYTVPDNGLNRHLADLACALAEQEETARGSCAAISAAYGAQS